MFRFEASTSPGSGLAIAWSDGLARGGFGQPDDGNVWLDGTVPQYHLIRHATEAARPPYPPK